MKLLNAISKLVLLICATGEVLHQMVAGGHIE